MNLILAIPPPARIAAAFLLGALAGSLVNFAVYRLAWNQRHIGPWSPPPPKAPPRHWFDRVPILGWLTLRREAAQSGRGFWIRPLSVELLAGAALAGLYWWYTEALGLLPPEVPHPAPPQWAWLFHGQFALHAVLLALLAAATLIDFDEKTIPDAITVPGTLLGVTAAAVFPWGLLPDLVLFLDMPHGFWPQFWGLLEPADWPVLTLASPHEWPDRLGGAPRLLPLAIALGCWWAWCFALMPRTWYARHGWRRAIELLLARLRREPITVYLVVLGAVGSLGILATWFVGGLHWKGLLSSLVGLAVGAGLIWIVRIVATWVLDREAMGFGDVTLLAMIGSFLGWQAAVMVFFLAPFAALAVTLCVIVFHRESEIPYGPYLCLPVVFLLIRWPALWEATAHVFILGGWLAAVFLVCIALMGLMLSVWRRIRDALFG